MNEKMLLKIRFTYINKRMNLQVGDGVGDGDDQDQEDGGESEMLVSFIQSFSIYYSYSSLRIFSYFYLEKKELT